MSAMLIGAIIAGCGGGSGAISGSSSTGVNSRSSPSAKLLQPGSPTNEIVESGAEAAESDRHAASLVLSKNLKAREEANFVDQCATLAPIVAKRLVPKQTSGPPLETSCPEALEKLALPLRKTKEIRSDTLSGPILALRMKGDRGEALFHGNDGKSYAMPMLKTDDGVWKVAAILAVELNPPQQPSSGRNGNPNGGTTK